MRGTLEWVSRKRDRCFIQCGTNHYFVHILEIKENPQIQPRDTVYFEKDADSGTFKLLSQ